MQKEQLIDVNAAQQALLIDEHTILELVYQFLDDKEHYTEPLKSSLAQRDWKNLIAYAHRIKGAANNLRVHGIGDPALHLEHAAEKQEVDACRRYIQLIEQRFSEIMQILNQADESIEKG